MEEAAEVIQAASKAIRFGINDYGDAKGKTNQEALIDEINDFFGVMIALITAGVLPNFVLNEDKVDAKVVKVIEFMKYAKERGTITDEAEKRPNSAGKE